MYIFLKYNHNDIVSYLHNIYRKLQLDILCFKKKKKNKTSFRLNYTKIIFATELATSSSSS